MIVLFRFYRAVKPFMENMFKKKPISSHDSIFSVLLLYRFESNERVCLLCKEGTYFGFFPPISEVII